MESVLASACDRRQVAVAVHRREEHRPIAALETHVKAGMLGDEAQT